ncbi:VOC family protein [Novosphingobium ginsenosidimutans]|uniref:VOC family protein n=1 Tax=Novosphingobium ginsenosidimutans TaxID=1176536 RepID=UPI00192DC1BB|nr:VOC family protein [Novosphingobium ginsenosidimutans]
MRVQQPNGIHHIAIMSADMKAQLTFFTQVMGFPLKGLFEMHGVPGGKHAFLEMGPESYFSVVELAGIDEIPARSALPMPGPARVNAPRGRCSTSPSASPIPRA